MSELTKYEWVCVGCELLIDGPTEEGVEASVQVHKSNCERFQNWSLDKEGT